MEQKTKGVNMARQPAIQDPTKCNFLIAMSEYEEIKKKAYTKRISVGKWIRRAIQAQLLKERMYE